MYRAGLEFILGFQLRGASLRIEPCIPRSWREYEMNYRFGSARYHIKVENPHGLSRGVARVEIDGKQQATADIPLRDDGASHTVRVVLVEQTPAEDGEARDGAAQRLI
jgi:cyclic beta-1,2-glucan synthetase